MRPAQTLPSPQNKRNQLLILETQSLLQSHPPPPPPLSPPPAPPALTRPRALQPLRGAQTNALIIQSDDARKQADNANACFRKLHALLLEAGKESVPNETAAGQKERVERLQKAEAAGRRRLKEAVSRKKAARRGSRGDD